MTKPIGSARITVSQLAKELGLTRRTIRKHIKLLEAHGYIRTMPIDKTNDAYFFEVFHPDHPAHKGD